MWIRSQDRKILTEIHDVEVDSGFKVWNQIFEDDSKKEQEEIEKKLKKKQDASLRKLKKMVQIKKETDEFVKKLKEQENDF